MKIALGAFALILTALTGEAIAAPKCPFNPTTSVPLNIGEGQLPTIPVQMNGRDELLVVDTGAPVSLISAGIVVELKLPRKPYPRGIYTLANGTSPEEVASIDTLSVGNLTGRDLSFFIVPSIQMPSTLAGSFGVDFLQDYDVDFDFGHKKFNLVPPDNCAGDPVYWAQGHSVRLPVHVSEEKHLRVTVKLDGKELDAVIDSGSSTSAMNLQAAEQMFDIHEQSLPMPRTAFAGVGREALLTGKAYMHTFKTLDLGGLSIPAPEILLASNLKLGSEQLIIGMSELKKMHLYISYKDKVAYITRADAH